MNQETRHLTQEVELDQSVRDEAVINNIIVIRNMHWTLLQHQLLQFWTISTKYSNIEYFPIISYNTHFNIGMRGTAAS